MSESSVFRVSDNDVSAVGQTRNSNAVYYLGNQTAKKRLLIRSLFCVSKKYFDTFIENLWIFDELKKTAEI